MRQILTLAFLFTFMFSALHSVALIVPVHQTSTSTVVTLDPLKNWKSLSQKERNVRVKEAKKEIKNFKREKRNGGEADTNTLLLVILAILLPPLAVYLHQGEINTKFWISLILTLLGFLPGIIYALIVVLGAA